MEKIATILDESPALALPLSRLLSGIREQVDVLVEREAWVLQRIRERPDRFKVIPDRLGPWTLWPEPAKKPGDGLEHTRPTPDPWIVVSSTPQPAVGPGGRFVRTIQETLQAWGWSVDAGSQVAIARWIRALGEGEAAVLRTTGARSP